MRLTKEVHSKTGKKISGVRSCNKCDKKEFLAKPNRWDLCNSCVKKELYESGKNKPPLNFKKISFFNYCENCNKSFEISCKYYNDQRFCSTDCGGSIHKNREPANKIWSSKEERTKHYYEMMKKDPKKWLDKIIRSRVNSAIKKTLIGRKHGRKNFRIGNIEGIIGCDILSLVRHLESKFENGMSWENYGIHGWHIDHIYPISKVNSLDKDSLKKVCNYKNLRPMWAKENRRKFNKITHSLEEVFSKEIL